MKKHSPIEFVWFLEDESILPILRGFSHPFGGRRHYEVFEGAGRKVFVKSFGESGMAGRVRQLLAPRGKKEFIIAQKLQALSVPAPSALGHGVGDMASAVVEVFIEGGSLLEHINAGANRDDLLRSLADFLILLREKNVRHDDLHLGNILVSGEEFCLVDLHKVRVKSSFSNDDEIVNLTHALGMIYYGMTPHERNVFFDRYGCVADMRKKVEDSIDMLRHRWVVKKMDRAFKNTSIVHCVGLDLFIRGRENKVKGGQVGVLKEDKKVKVERYNGYVRKVYAKRRRLKDAWQNHVVLEYMHTHLVPAAFSATLLPVSGGAGCIAMEDLCEKGEELDRYLDRNYDAMGKGERRVLVDTLAAFFRDAMAWGITHRDLKACNVFVLASGDFLLLDVEDIRFVKATAQTLARAFIQLNNTVPKRVASRDRMRFFLRLAPLIDTDKKRLFREVLAASQKESIVYEGISGLVEDNW